MITLTESEQISHAVELERGVGPTGPSPSSNIQDLQTVPTVLHQNVFRVSLQVE